MKAAQEGEETKTAEGEEEVNLENEAARGLGNIESRNTRQKVDAQGNTVAEVVQRNQTYLANATLDNTSTLNTTLVMADEYQRTHGTESYANTTTEQAASMQPKHGVKKKAYRDKEAVSEPREMPITPSKIHKKSASQPFSIKPKKRDYSVQPVEEENFRRSDMSNVESQQDDMPRASPPPQENPMRSDKESSSVARNASVVEIPVRGGDHEDESPELRISEDDIGLSGEPRMQMQVSKSGGLINFLDSRKTIRRKRVLLPGFPLT